MIGIDAFTACFHRPVAGLEGCVTLVPTQKARKTTSPVAAYALEAVKGLPAFDLELPLFTLCGATGSTSRAFDGAKSRSTDGTLTGGGFCQGGFKRIHPLTLITSLQNQIPAVLSMSLGLTGPCLNALDSACALADLLPNMTAMVQAAGSGLLVMACAGDRDEERAKSRFDQPTTTPLEGAICLLLSPEGKLGTLSSPTEPISAPQNPVTEDGGVLSGGVALLRALQKQGSHNIATNDGTYARSFLVTSKPQHLA